MNEFTYGFINEQNILIGFAVIEENDQETLERIKIEYGASLAYKMDLEKEPTVLNNTYWNGSRFVPLQPYLSWIFNENTNMWESPVAEPEFDPENPVFYRWNEEILNWEEISG
jgi:hypothetical protein